MICKREKTGSEGKSLPFGAIPIAAAAKGPAFGRGGAAFYKQSSLNNGDIRFTL